MNTTHKSLVDPDVQKKWDHLLESGNDKLYPSLDLVRLEKWHFGGVGSGRLLEYACGLGVNLIHLLKCGYTVDAIDASPNAVARVERKLAALPELRDRASLKVIDVNADKLPYADQTFDFVNCMNVLSLLGSAERVEALLAEFVRVMKPGAKIILDINGPLADFAAKAKPLGGDAYLYGDPPVPTYCPASADAFVSIVKPWFEITDVGFTHYKYCGGEIQEFIICAHKHRK